LRSRHCQFTTSARGPPGPPSSGRETGGRGSQRSRGCRRTRRLRKYGTRSPRAKLPLRRSAGIESATTSDSASSTTTNKPGCRWQMALVDSIRSPGLTAAADRLVGTRARSRAEGFSGPRNFRAR
jgi:hypothetical protein